MRPRRTGRTALALAAAAVLLAGCGGDPTPAGPGPGPGSTGDPVPGCPAGTDPDTPGPRDQARPPTGGGLLGLLPAAVDVESRALVALARGETWTLDLCSNTWQRQSPDAGPDLTAGLELVYDADSDLVVSWSPRDREAWAYDLDRDEWTRLGPPPAGAKAWADPVYEPLSGLVVVRDGRTGSLRSYDVDTDTWRRLAGPAESRDRDSDGHHHSFMVADPARHQLILVLTDPGTPGHTWLFDLDTRRWALSEAVPPDVVTGFLETGGEMVLDEAAGEAVLLGVAVMGAFDPVTETWRDIELGEPVLAGASDGLEWAVGPAARTAHTLVYDPLHERVLLLGGRQRRPDERRSTGVGWGPATGVWAYDAAADSWLELVPAQP